MKNIEIKIFVCVDENGQPLGPPEICPEPDRYVSEGLAQIAAYVARLFVSAADFTSLIIATPAEDVAVGLWRRDGWVQLNLSVEWRVTRQREQTIRQFFSHRGI